MGDKIRAEIPSKIDLVRVARYAFWFANVLFSTFFDAKIVPAKKLLGSKTPSLQDIILRPLSSMYQFFTTIH